jgi:hypothetical protein
VSFFQGFDIGRKIGDKNDVISITSCGDKELSGGDARFAAATR